MFRGTSPSIPITRLFADVTWPGRDRSGERPGDKNAADTVDECRLRDAVVLPSGAASLFTWPLSERVTQRSDPSAPGFLDATALMEYLIKRGVTMRTGHGTVGKLVAECEGRKCQLKNLSLEDLQTACYLRSIDIDVLLATGIIGENFLWRARRAPPPG
jgi:hypothetical protein